MNVLLTRRAVLMQIVKILLDPTYATVTRNITGMARIVSKVNLISFQNSCFLFNQFCIVL